MTKFYAWAAAAIALIGIGTTAGYIYTSGGNEDLLANCRAGQVGGADIGGPFNLVNKDGETVDDKAVITKPTLVYFGYTFCPDVCPMDMVRNAETVDLLAEQGQDLGLLFITVDPERDTPQVSADFAQAIHPKAIGLSGSQDQINAAAKAYKVYHKVHKENDPEFYPVDHSSFTYLMLPGLGFADFYKSGDTAETIAKSASCMIKAAAG